MLTQYAIKDLERLSGIIHPDILITTITNPMEGISTRAYLEKFSASFPLSRMMVSGRVFFEINEQIELPKNVILF